MVNSGETNDIDGTRAFLDNVAYDIKIYVSSSDAYNSQIPNFINIWSSANNLDEDDALTVIVDNYLDGPPYFGIEPDGTRNILNQTEFNSKIVNSELPSSLNAISFYQNKIGLTYTDLGVATTTLIVYGVNSTGNFQIVQGGIGAWAWAYPAMGATIKLWFGNAPTSIIEPLQYISQPSIIV